MEIQIDLFNSPSTQNVPMLSLSYILNITINFGLIIISFIQMHAHRVIIILVHGFMRMHTKPAIFSFSLSFQISEEPKMDVCVNWKQHLSFKSCTLLVGYFHFPKRSERQ